MCIGRDPTRPASRSDSLNSTFDTNLGTRVDQRVACRGARPRHLKVRLSSWRGDHDHYARYAHQRSA
jgi:hypothetical protein